MGNPRVPQTENEKLLGEWQGFFCRRRDRFDPVVFTSLIYPPIVSPSNGRILSKLALFERQWMATLSVGRDEMYTQPVSAERILAIHQAERILCPVRASRPSTNPLPAPLSPNHILHTMTLALLYVLINYFEVFEIFLHFLKLFY